MSQVSIPHDVRVIGGVIVREFHISAGTTLRSHEHPYDHLSFLLSGTAILVRDDAVDVLTGPCAVEIKANVLHTLHAKTDCVWDCIHGLEAAKASGDDLLMEGIA